MEKVYITESTFKNLIKKTELDKYLETSLPHYEKLKYILALPEKNQLIKYAKLLEDFKNFSNYQKINKVYESDPKTRLIFFKKKPSSYHLDEDCIYLNSNYENFEIPVEIKDENIETYRSFFLKNKYLYENNRIAFLAKAEIKFNIIIKNVKEIHGENSGIEKIKNFRVESPNTIIDKISILIKDMDDYRSSDADIEKLIKDVGFATHKAKYINNNKDYVLHIKNENSPIYHWHKYKIKLKSLIEKYFILTFNTEFKFERSILEQCGLTCCRSCLQKK